MVLNNFKKNTPLMTLLFIVFKDKSWRVRYMVADKFTEVSMYAV